MDIAIASSPIPSHIQQPQPSAINAYHYNTGPAPVHRSPMRGRGTNGHGPASRGRGSRGRGRGAAQRQVTPPFVYLQRVNGSPSTNMEIESLPPNHIHIVQTNPNLHNPMNRSSSNLSAASVPPTISNGHSSTEGSYGDIESYHTSPQQLQQGHIAGLIPSGHVKEDKGLWQSHVSPIETGCATQVVTRLFQGLGRMKNGTFDEWLTFIDENFEQGARCQIILAGENLRAYDVLASSLPRFFMTLSHSGSGNHIFVLDRLVESVDSLSVDIDHLEWYMGSQILNGSASGIISSNFKLDKLELVIEDTLSEIPEMALRVLEYASQIECVMEVMDVVENKNIPPNRALEELAEV